MCEALVFPYLSFLWYPLFTPSLHHNENDTTTPPTKTCNKLIKSLQTPFIYTQYHNYKDENHENSIDCHGCVPASDHVRFRHTPSKNPARTPPITNGWISRRFKTNSSSLLLRRPFRASCRKGRFRSNFHDRIRCEWSERLS